MRINAKKVIGMRVETQSGVYLGLVRDMVLDVDSQSIVVYVVRKLLWGREEYHVGRGSVRRITRNKIVVDDAVVDEEEKESAVSKHTAVPSEVMRVDSKTSDPSPQ